MTTCLCFHSKQFEESSVFIDVVSVRNIDVCLHFNNLLRPNRFVTLVNKYLTLYSHICTTARLIYQLTAIKGININWNHRHDRRQPISSHLPTQPTTNFKSKGKYIFSFSPYHMLVTHKHVTCEYVEREGNLSFKYRLICLLLCED